MASATGELEKRHEGPTNEAKGAGSVERISTRWGSLGLWRIPYRFADGSVVPLKRKSAVISSERVRIGLR
jgi:hypothetical protein